MVLSNFVTNDKKETLSCLSSKSNLLLVENISFKPQEALETKMNKTNNFSFIVPVALFGKWMIGHASLEA